MSEIKLSVFFISDWWELTWCSCSGTALPPVGLYSHCMPLSYPVDGAAGRRRPSDLRRTPPPSGSAPGSWSPPCRSGWGRAGPRPRPWTEERVTLMFLVFCNISVCLLLCWLGKEKSDLIHFHLVLCIIHACGSACSDKKLLTRSIIIVTLWCLSHAVEVEH